MIVTDIQFLQGWVNTECTHYVFYGVPRQMQLSKTWIQRDRDDVQRRIVALHDEFLIIAPASERAETSPAGRCSEKQQEHERKHFLKQQKPSMTN